MWTGKARSAFPSRDTARAAGSLPRPREPPGTPTWRVLFYAQQHGDEVSGKDALLYLVRDIAREPGLLPPDVDLWVLPMMNPDGAEAGTRRNAAGADLNRDHIVLEQPETQALHRVARRVRPHLAVDCHEFTRDSEERRKRGWIAWPDITMDGVNNPLFDPAVVAAARRWVEESAAPGPQAGHAFLRYSVGGLPPDEEQRHSAPDMDSGLNAVGLYGGLSFIIEAAVRRVGPGPVGRPRGTASTRTSSSSGASSGRRPPRGRPRGGREGPAHGPCRRSSRRTTSGSTRA